MVARLKRDTTQKDKGNRQIALRFCNVDVTKTGFKVLVVLTEDSPKKKKILKFEFCYTWVQQNGRGTGNAGGGVESRESLLQESMESCT